MSTNRIKRDSGWVHPSKLPKGPNGRNLCRQCNEEVPKGRRTFCGDDCVDAWKIKTDPGHVRNLVFRRDQGVCALCGLDSIAFTRGLPSRYDHSEPAEARRQEALAKGWPEWFINQYRRRSPWDADHIVPVIEGGGECDLDNYRTLCIPCHQRVTAELAARRAARRRAQEGTSTGQLSIDMEGS
jgi:5-methylcytosine-specific restriction endonuclease McrA